MFAFTKTSLDDILGSFSRVKADLEKFIQDHHAQIQEHDEQISQMQQSKEGLIDTKAKAETVHQNITKLLAA